MIKVTDVNGKEVTIEESKRKLYDYDNKNKKIIYSAPICGNSDIEFWTEYVVNGTVDEFEDRILTWNNPVKYLYAALVKYDSTKNDPEQFIFNTLVDFVKNNADQFFTKSGDWKKVIRYDTKAKALIYCKKKELVTRDENGTITDAEEVEICEI